VAGVLTVIAIVSAIVTVNLYRSAGAFRAAPVCAVPVAGQAGCRALVPATVAEIVITSGRNTQYRMRIDAAAQSGTYSFPDDEEILDTSTVGDLVTAEVWHGDVVAIDDDDGRTLTVGAPLYQFRQAVGIAVSAGLLALVLFLVYIWDVQSVFRRSMTTTLVGWRAGIYTTAVFVACSYMFTAVIELLDPQLPLRWPLLGSLAVITLLGTLKYAYERRVQADELWKPRRRRSTGGPSRRKR
jgi:hypothetical protein